ncbi:MAG: Holliday junction branch migration protein RuvA [bacterium]|nr:Holliday junction branch migration protein RuvA [bacterium]
MIVTLEGKLTHKSPTYIILDAGGIGYGLHVPLSTYHKLPQISESARVFTHLAVREDAFVLYGFYSPEERDVFFKICSVTGVGPKCGLALLSALSVEEIKEVIYKKDMASLTAISGIGKRTAERIIFELKDKIEPPSTQVKEGREDIMQDAEEALISLGYERVKAQKAIKKARERLEGTVSLERLIKEALKNM